MTTNLEDENLNLRRQLKAFVTQARVNEEKLQRFNEQELKLISATSLAELVTLILHHYPQTFQLDCITLHLYDPEYELLRIIENAGLMLEETPGLIIETELSALQDTFADIPRPRLGSYCEQEHRHYFPSPPQPVRSCALLPLIRRGELIGSLNLGSYQQERFLQGSGTDFLERLAAIVAICLENCANQQRLQQMGLTDPLTRIHNRRYFDQRLQEEVATVNRTGQPLSCMFIDIDHFKQINDTLGHQAGDQVLRELATLVNRMLRHNDVFCRYGGEEFVVLLPATAPDECHQLAERIRHLIEQHRFVLTPGDSLGVTISIGISCLETPHSSEVAAEPSTELLAAADQAVYRAKTQGRNRVITQALPPMTSG